MAYTQEQYKVKYGLTKDSLHQIIEVMSSPSEGSNMTYKAALLSLSPNTVYYFQVNSSNSKGVTLSPPATLKTLEAGNHYIGYGCVTM